MRSCPVLGWSVLLAAAACSSPRERHVHHRVAAAEFVALLQRPIGSVAHAQFLGVDGRYAYATFWRMGSLGGEVHDVYSTALDGLPAPERTALREGRNPWARDGWVPDGGALRPAELAALRAAERLPAQNPNALVLRCAAGQPPQVATYAHRNGFTAADVVPVPVPCDLVLVATADTDATVRIAGRADERLEAGTPRTLRVHLGEPAAVDVAVTGGSGTWTLQLQCVPAAQFHAPDFVQTPRRR